MIPDSVIHGICKDLVTGKGIRETARKWNVGHTTVANIRDGKIRKDISSQYDMSGLSDAEKLSLQTGEHVVEYTTRKGEPTNLLVTNLGRFFRAGSLKELNPSVSNGRDPVVILRVNDGAKTTIPCKKVVAEMFCTNPEGYKDVIYKDGDILNLKSTNLKFVSHSKACKAAENYELRRTYDGSYNPNAKLTEEDIDAIYAMYFDMGMHAKAIAKAFNVNKNAIKKIINGENWAKKYAKYMKTKYENASMYRDNLIINL